MLRTISTKLIFIYLNIILISLVITGISLYIFLGNFVIEEKVKLLTENSSNINAFLNSYLEDQDNLVIKSLLGQMLEFYGTSLRSIIWIANKKGYIIFKNEGKVLIDGEDISDTINLRLKDSDGRLKFPDVRQYERLISADTDINREIGDFYGVFKDTKVEWLTIEKKIMYQNKIIGGIYLSTPVPEVQKARSSVFEYFLISVSISILVSIILVYIFSLKITRPLKELNIAARKIARGDFKKRVRINKKDEIGELANSFNYMANSLENIEKMRRDFIANVSHELRTPMTSIRGFIDGIIDNTIPKELHKNYLEVVRDEIIRLSRLVNDLLDLTRMESGEIKLSLKDFNINEMIRRCIIKLEGLIIKKDIDIILEFGEYEFIVKADKDAIERVMINLLHNAIKFTPKNGKIIFKTYLIKDKVYISIKDNGIGIKKEEIDLIWEKFHKSDKSRSRMGKGGAGLGLYIVKNIINEHQEEIFVESEVNKGTEIRFSLRNS